eukprot:g12480.t1
METSRAIKLLQSAYARSVQVSGAAHSFAMHAAALKSRWGLSLMLYDDLRHSGSRPTDVTINNLAIAFRHLPRNPAAAFRRVVLSAWSIFCPRKGLDLNLQEIQAQALRLNAIFLGNAVRGSSSSRQWQEAVELCRVTRVVQLRCDAYVFNNAMSGMGRLAQWRQTLQFMEEARETQVFTSDPTSLGERVSQHRLLNSALSGMAAASQRGLATQLLQDLKRSDVRIDVISMGSLAKAFEHESLWTSVLSTLDALRHHDLNFDCKGEERPPPKAFKGSNIQAGSPYSKELRLLAHVFETATAGDPSSVCDAIERFGEDVLNPAGQWLKVAGRHKTTVLSKAMKNCPKGGSILEIGTYCGYSALRMAMALPGARVVSLEVDPAHMVIARNMVAYAGMAHMIDIWTGHSKDVLPRLPQRYGGRHQFRLGYHEDLSVIEQLGLLLPGAVVVADNVLKPGSPLFLWRLCKGSAYDNHIVRVKEFAMPSEDWMSVSVLRPEAAVEMESMSVEVPTVERGKGQAPQGAWPVPPEELIQLQWESDRIRAQATRPGRGSVSFAEWASYAEGMKACAALDGYLATVRVYEASLRELREQMGRVHRLVHGFGLFQVCMDLMDREAPLRPFVEIAPPWWFAILRACTGIMRILALTTAAYFAAQYFIRYGPQAAKDNLPMSLDSLLAWSDEHNKEPDRPAETRAPETAEADAHDLREVLWCAGDVLHCKGGGLFALDACRNTIFQTLL